LQWGELTNNYLSENEYYMHLAGVGGNLDGKPAAEVALKAWRSSSQDEKYGFAQFVNHPSANLRPNVASVPFQWSEAIDSYLDALVHRNINRASLREQLCRFARQVNPVASGVWFVDPITDEVATFENSYGGSSAGCAYVSTHDIDSNEDEIELLVNYDFAAKNGRLPAWYIPVESDPE
jgi:hypothetical protein